MTDKQREILKLLCKLNADGSFLDLDQLKERLSYKPSKDALQFSLRFMINRGWIERKGTELRRGARRRVLAPTFEGYEEYRAIIRGV